MSRIMHQYFVIMSIAFLVCLGVPAGNLSANSLSIPSYDYLSEMGATLSGSVFKPRGDGPFPTVVLMHGCSGLNHDVTISLESHASFLVRNGYAALILDSFTSRRKSGGIVCKSYDELANARYYRKADAYNALRYLRTLPYVDANNIFLMGQSNGGSVALAVAGQIQRPEIPEELNFNAVVAFYPWCGALTKRLRTPVLVLGGEKDDWTPLALCLFAQKQDMGKEYKVIEYKNAHHSFDLFKPVGTYNGHTVGANAKARIDSGIQMLRWFERFRN